MVVASKNQLAPCSIFWVTTERERQIAREGPPENPRSEFLPLGLITPTKYLERQKYKPGFETRASNYCKLVCLDLLGKRIETAPPSVL